MKTKAVSQANKSILKCWTWKIYRNTSARRLKDIVGKVRFITRANRKNYRNQPRCRYQEVRRDQIKIWVKHVNMKRTRSQGRNRWFSRNSKREKIWKSKPIWTRNMKLLQTQKKKMINMPFKYNIRVAWMKMTFSSCRVLLETRVIVSFNSMALWMMRLRKRSSFLITNRVEARRRISRIRRWLSMVRWWRGCFLMSWLRRSSQGLRRTSIGSMFRINQVCTRGKRTTRRGRQIISWIPCTLIVTQPDSLKTATRARDWTNSTKLISSSDWRAKRKQNQEIKANTANQLDQLQYHMANWDKHIEWTPFHPKML